MHHENYHLNNLWCHSVYNAILFSHIENTTKWSQYKVQSLHQVGRAFFHASVKKTYCVKLLPECEHTCMWIKIMNRLFHLVPKSLHLGYSVPQAVVSLDFHPTVSVLASGSKDCTVKFFDYSKPSVKRSYRAIHEVASARCLVFHPSGDYLLVGTEQPTCEFNP